MKETTLYVCEICGEKYTSITEAENCEAAHIKPKMLTKTMKWEASCHRGVRPVFIVKSRMEGDR